MHPNFEIGVGLTFAQKIMKKLISHLFGIFSLNAKVDSVRTDDARSSGKPVPPAIPTESNSPVNLESSPVEDLDQAMFDGLFGGGEGHPLNGCNPQIFDLIVHGGMFAKPQIARKNGLSLLIFAKDWVMPVDSWKDVKNLHDLIILMKRGAVEGHSGKYRFHLGSQPVGGWVLLQRNIDFPLDAEQVSGLFFILNELISRVELNGLMQAMDVWCEEAASSN